MKKQVFTAFALLVASLALYLLVQRGAWQDRALMDSPPSGTHPLGTDELGRDRAMRLIKGSAVSLLLAPAAALLAALLGAAIGGFAGYVGGLPERAIVSAIDVFVSLPWLFVLLAVRALLPLNTSPAISVAITFLLLGFLGWPVCARIVRARMREVCTSEYHLRTLASGISPWRLFWRHLLPNVRPVLATQFWLAVPLFILAEANLALLGLGVSEPLPSWGNLLRELEDFQSVPAHPERLAALVMLIIVLTALQRSRPEKLT